MSTPPARCPDPRDPRQPPSSSRVWALTPRGRRTSPRPRGQPAGPGSLSQRPDLELSPPHLPSLPPPLLRSDERIPEETNLMPHSRDGLTEAHGQVWEARSPSELGTAPGPSAHSPVRSPPAPRGRAAARRRPRPGTRAGSGRKRTSRGSRRRCCCCRRGPRGGAAARSAGRGAGRAGGDRSAAPASRLRVGVGERRQERRRRKRRLRAQRLESSTTARRRLYWSGRPRGPAPTRTARPLRACSRATPGGRSGRHSQAAGASERELLGTGSPRTRDMRGRHDLAKGGRFHFVSVPD